MKIFSSVGLLPPAIIIAIIIRMIDIGENPLLYDEVASYYRAQEHILNIWEISPPADKLSSGSRT